MKTWKINVTHTGTEETYGFTLERMEAPTENEILDTLDTDKYPRHLVKVTITEVNV